MSVYAKKNTNPCPEGGETIKTKGRGWGKGFGVKLRGKETKRRKELEEKEKKWR